MKKRLLGVIMATIFSLTLLTGCGGSKSTSTVTGVNEKGEEIYTWHLAHEEYDGNIQDVYAKEFAKVLYEKSNGRINLEIYPVGQIGDATQQAELLQNGGIEFAIISPGNIGTMVPENQLFSLHFLFSDDMEKTKKVLKESKALNEMLNAKYLEKRIKVLSYWQEGAMQWTSNKPLHSTKDFKGVKFRTMPSPMIVAAYEAYGANPTPMPYMEVYSGLQLNMIEGQENPISAIEDSKFYEVQKYLTLAGSNLYITSTCVNPDFFESLPDDMKQIVLDSIDEMNDRSFEIVDELNGKALGEITSKSNIKVEELTDAEKEDFRKAAMSAYDVYKKMVGKDGAAILDKLLEEIAAVDKEQ